MTDDFSWGFGAITRCCPDVNYRQKQHDGYCKHCGDET